MDTRPEKDVNSEEKRKEGMCDDLFHQARRLSRVRTKSGNEHATFRVSS